MNGTVSAAWAAVSLATAKPLAVDCGDGQMKRGGGGGGEEAVGGGTARGGETPSREARLKGEYGAGDAGGRKVRQLWEESVKKG